MQVAHQQEIVPSSLYSEVEMSLTQLSQVIGTEKVVYYVVESLAYLLYSVSEQTDLEGFNHGGEVDPMPGR